MKGMACQTYQYSPLDATTPHIRLLKVLPGLDDDVIRLELDNVQVDDETLQYDAISYTWGTDNAMREVKIANKSLLLRTNIWQFFKHCRRTKLTMNKLWVDSVCINQEDHVERTAQVRYMAAIFAKAGRVLIWLGGDVSCLPLMSIVAERKPMHGTQDQDYQENLFFKPTKDGTKDGHTMVRADILQDFANIMYSSYWWRVWIIQEICLNSRTYIVAGKLLLDLSLLLKLKKWIYSSTLESTVIPKFHLETANAHVMRLRSFVGLESSLNPVALHLVHLRKVLGLVEEAHKTKSPQTLGALLSRLCHQVCQEPRDMIYGMMGLLSEEIRSKITITYTSPVEDLFLQALFCLAEEVKYNKRGSPLTSLLCYLLKSLKLSPLEVALYIEMQDICHPIHDQRVTINRDLNHFSFLHPCTKPGRTPLASCRRSQSGLRREEETAHEPDAVFLGHPFIDEETIYHQTAGYKFQLAKCCDASVLCCDFDYNIRLCLVRHASDNSQSLLTIVKRHRDDDFEYYRPISLPNDVKNALEDRVNGIRKFSDVWKASEESQDVPITCTTRELMYLLSWRDEWKF